MALNRKDHKAYLFIASQDMRYFDVEKGNWGLLRTTYKGKWPYDMETKNGVMHCIDGKLYVFGGINPTSPIGTDLFMVLDIETKVWRLLSGSEIPKPSFSSPGPREHACSWVGKGGKKIYIMYGDADRMAAEMQGTPHGCMTTYDYDDLWCWDKGNLDEAEDYWQPAFEKNGDGLRLCTLFLRFFPLSDITLLEPSIG